MDRQHHDIDIPETAQRVIDVLEQGGCEVWTVGGFVRDALLGRPCHDIDLTTDAHWPQVKELCEAAGLHTFETGVEHGTLTVTCQDDVFEVTTFRTDGTYSDARHPDQVAFVGSIDEDLARRDFTINAMAYRPRSGLRDPFGGAADLESSIIRAVGDPETRFGEDALRILRAIRFSSQLGFEIETATMQGMRARQGLLDEIAAERIEHELEGLLLGDHVCTAIMSCEDVLAQVLPELEPMRGLDQRTPYHIYDVLEHTAHVVQNTPAYPLVRWAALFHDMGKPATFFTDEDGIGHFYGHPAISVEIARSIMRRLKMSPRFAHDVLALVAHHDEQVEPTPRAVKRMLQKLDGRPDLFRALCDLKRADALSQAPGCRGRVKLACDLDDCLTAIMAEHQAFRLSDLAIDGNDVMALGVEPGPRVGALLHAALDAVIDEKAANDREALTTFVRDALH